MVSCKPRVAYTLSALLVVHVLLLPERASISPSHLMHACFGVECHPAPYEELPRQAKTQTHTRDVRTLPCTQMHIKAYFYTKSYSLEMEGMVHGETHFLLH